MNDAAGQHWFIGISLGAYIVICPIVCWILARSHARKAAAVRIAEGAQATKAWTREEQKSLLFVYAVLGGIGFLLYLLLVIFVASS